MHISSNQKETIGEVKKEYLRYLKTQMVKLDHTFL